MRALVCHEYGPPSGLKLETRQDPAPGVGEVLIDMRAAAINFPDILSIAGQYQTRSDPPFVPGFELAGVISAIGSDVEGYSVGDPVIANSHQGAFAERCIAEANACYPLPPRMSFAQGAAFTVTYATTYHALVQSARIKPGETLLVLGAAGGVGTAAIEIGTALGARVIAAASTDEKLSLARQLGADEAINYSSENLREALKARLDGQGVDVVYDPVGGELAQMALRSLNWHGRYLVIGFASGKIPDFPANIALLKEASITGVWWGTWAARNPREHMANMQALCDLFEAGKLAPRISGAYKLEDYVEAFDDLIHRRALGKVVFQVGES